MYKAVKSCLLLSALGLCFSGAVHSADIENGVVVRLSPEEQAGFSLDLSKLKLARNAPQPKKAADGVSTLGPAAGISFFQIYAVQSSWATDYQSDNWYRTATQTDHGGTTLWVYVLQYGYGNPNNGTMNAIGKYPTSSALCGSFSALHYCTVGETVTGWLYRYDFSGQQGGHFSASANSTSSPFGYWSDSIYIY
jgi:Domain of unknown function (DUF4879)